MRIKCVLPSLQLSRIKELSTRKAATAYGVPKDALNRQVNGRLTNLSVEERHKNALGRYRAVLIRMIKRKRWKITLL